MSYVNLLGKRIKEVRKSKGLTQDALSEKIGIDSKHLSRIECGKNRPSIELLYKISAVLNIEPYLIFQNKHLQEKDELIKEITFALSDSPEEKVRLFYKILFDIIS